MDRDRIDYWCEKGILVLVASMLVLAVLAMGAVGSVAWLAIQTLMCGVLALWIPRVWVRSNYRVLFPPISGAVLVFAAYTVFTSGQAAVPHDARAELLKVLVYAFVFFAILDNLHGQEDLQTLAFVLIFLGLSVSIYAVYQFITNSPYVWFERKSPGYSHRGSGPYHCPNHLAGFLEMVLPLSLAYVMTGRLKHTTKVFLGYAAVAMLAGIGVTVSRGGWIATTAALGLFFLLLLGNRTYRLPALIIAVLFIATGVFFYQQGYQPQKRFNELAEQQKSNDIRFRLWQPAMAIWKEHFWLGAGPGQFDHAFRRHRPHDIQMRPLYAHNDYLNALADYGTAGTAIIGAALALFFYSVVKVWKFVQRSNDIGTKPSNRSALVLGGTLGLVAILIHSVVDFNLHIPANALVAVTILALVSGHVRFATERFWFNPRWFGKGIVTLALVAGLGFLAGQTVASARHDWFAAHAKRADTNEAKVALLQQAAAADPTDYETTYELGETLRLWSWQGEAGYEKLAAEALPWFEAGMKLNPLDPYNFARYGMCLHWLGRHEEATPYFERALERDPNNYYIVGLRGWHEFQLEYFDSAKGWFEKSRQLALRRFDVPWPDEMAWQYLRLIEQKQKEKAGSTP